jgi:hypothetical protein
LSHCKWMLSTFDELVVKFSLYPHKSSSTPPTLSRIIISSCYAMVILQQ